MTNGFDIRRHIFAHETATRKERMLPDANKLVYSTNAAYDRPIAYHYMSGHLSAVAENAIISNDTIMSNVTVSHDKTVAAHFCFDPVSSAAMNSHKFTNDCVISNLNKSF